MPERLKPSDRLEWSHYGHQHLQRYRFALQKLEGTRVLDMACGVGYGSYIMSQGRGREVTGIDLDKQAIEYGNKHYKRSGLRLVNADALHWQSEGDPFDTVVSFETIEHLPNPQSFVSRVAKLIKPGGRFLVSAPNILQHQKAAEPIANPYHLNEPDHATLCTWLEPFFVVEEEWEQSTVVTPGSDSFSALRAEADELQRRWWLRAANRLESFVRGKGSCDTVKHRREVSPRMVGSTDIFPLLPERREDCEVFLFVCRRF
jgi:SAM-dependent methyltransferase